MFDLLFPKHWSTLKKLIWLKAAALSSAVVKTVTAAIVHIKDALAGPAQNLTIAIEPVQDLNGYDSPWPAGGGKNLMPAIISGAITSHGVTFTPLENGDVVVSGTSTAAAPTSNATISLPAGTYTLSCTATAGSNETGVQLNNSNSVAHAGRPITFTLAEAGTINLRYRVDSGITIDETWKAQLESGSSATDWVPYSNICPITGWTGANVTRTGKNLFDKATAVFVAGGFNNGVIASYSNQANTYLPCKPNTTYTISRKRTVDNERFAVAWCADTPAAGVAIFGAKSITNYGENIGETLSLTITTGTTAKYLAIWAYWAATDITEAKNTLQIELGSTATAYESYTGTTISITFPTPPGTVYGGTLDVTTGELTVTMASVDMGTLTWERNTSGTYPYFYSPYFNAAARPAGISVLCSAYKAVANQNGTTFRAGDNDCCICIDRQSARPTIIVQDSSYSDPAVYKTAVSGVQFVYELATPQTYQLSPTEVQLLAGENNIWADTGNTTLTYLADGRASDTEALNILLGGAYRNSGAADEATDKEALEILLGGTK